MVSWGQTKTKKLREKKQTSLLQHTGNISLQYLVMCPSFSQFAGSLLAGTYTGDQMKNVDSKITGSSESTLEIKNYTGVGNVFLLHFSAP